MPARKTPEYQRLALELREAFDNGIGARHGGRARQRPGHQHDLVTAPGEPFGKAAGAHATDMRKIRMTVSDNQDFDGPHRTIL